MERTVVNVQTGEVSVVPLTPEEIAEIQSRPAPEPEPELTPHEKLKRVGLTVDELKALLVS
jgi:hypothetical protein